MKLVMGGGSVDPLLSPSSQLLSSTPPVQISTPPPSLRYIRCLASSFSCLVYGVMYMSGGTVNDREASHNEMDDNESAPQLSTDTSVVYHADHRQIGTPPLTCANSDDDDPMRIVGIDKTPLNSSNHDTHVRVRAMSESERTLFSSANGVRMFQKEPSHFYSKLTPPLSSSFASLETHNPYSTSAHIIPLEAPLGSILNSPQSNFGFVYTPRRPAVTPRSVGLNYHNSEISSLLSPTDGVARSMSFSYGGHSTQQTYVDASSYDSIPDSPATRVQISG